jgi:hypothetical protein
LRCRSPFSYHRAAVAMPYLTLFAILFLLGLLVACVIT